MSEVSEVAFDKGGFAALAVGVGTGLDGGALEAPMGEAACAGGLAVVGEAEGDCAGFPITLVVGGEVVGLEVEGAGFDAEDTAPVGDAGAFDLGATGFAVVVIGVDSGG